MRYIVTSALPYANASLHLGHMLEAIQTDIWVRSLTLNSHEAYYFCASDTHGTPVMLKAKELNVSPEGLVTKMKIEHQKTFEDFITQNITKLSWLRDEGAPVPSAALCRLLP